MEADRGRWSRFFHRLGVRLITGCAYPCIGVGAARALIDPGATAVDCLSDALLVLIFIAASACTSLITGWLITRGE